MSVNAIHHLCGVFFRTWVALLPQIKKVPGSIPSLFLPCWHRFLSGAQIFPTLSVDVCM